MTKHFIIFLLFNFSVTFSQTADTLVFGHQKFKLKKTKTFRPSSQKGRVFLPVEYKNLNNPTSVRAKYKLLVDSSYGIYNDEMGNEVWVKSFDCKDFPFYHNQAYLNNLTDTVFLNVRQFYLLRPYIKARNKKIYFARAATLRIYNDTAERAFHYNLNNGYLLAYWQSSFSENKDTLKLKNSTFILRDLYYIKGLATYHLDREFIIKVR